MESKQKTTRRASGRSILSDEEKAAMLETVRERKRGSANGEAEVLEKIAEMQPSDREMAERIHALIRSVAPQLEPRTWYGMPAYAKDGAPMIYFQAAQKFKARYAMLGFNDKANLDDGDVWPVAYALKRLSAADEKKIGELVKRAAG